MTTQFPSPERLKRHNASELGEGIGLLILMTGFLGLSLYRVGLHNGITYFSGACWFLTFMTLSRSGHENWLQAMRGRFDSVTFDETELVFGTGRHARRRAYADVVAVTTSIKEWPVSPVVMDPEDVTPMVAEQIEKKTGKEVGLRQQAKLIFTFDQGPEIMVTLMRPTKTELKAMADLFGAHGLTVKHGKM